MSFQLSDSDFNDFNSYLKSNNFAFKTKTEDALTKVLDVAKEEELDGDLKASYNALISKLNTVKSEAISTNKEQLKNLLENEIIKRYFYREGLYKYFLANNSEVKKAASILANPSEYNGYLKP
jgi:carboxyl-terminal processing protease